MSKLELEEIIISVLKKMQSEGLINNDTVIDATTILYGENGILPSIHLITAVIDIENEIFNRIGTRISLTDVKMFSPQNSPFLSVNKLTEFTNNLVS